MPAGRMNCTNTKHPQHMPCNNTVQSINHADTHQEETHPGSTNDGNTGTTATQVMMLRMTDAPSSHTHVCAHHPAGAAN